VEILKVYKNNAFKIINFVDDNMEES